MITTPPIFHIFAICAFLLTGAPATAAQESLRLAPSTHWVIDYQEEGCRLLRQFGKDEDKTILILSRYGPEVGVDLTVGGKPVEQTDGNQPVYLKFGPYDDEQKRDFFAGSLGEDMPAIVLMGRYAIAARSQAQEELLAKNPEWEETIVAPVSTEQKAAASYLSIRHSGQRAVILETGAMDKPLAALSTCVDELMTHWGIDVQAHKNLKQHVEPKNNPERWIVPNDYPTNMFRQRQSAIVQFRLNIDATGEVTDCHAQKTARPEDFDALCKSLMERAKFTPALDADGHPIASYWTTNLIRFQIPR